ncbi:TniQ family protein [Undibacterium sp. TJN19]|uniref:TniQ family protein n=1 Tax=Undibacterium sp. TJN19 TaxID=3413055 RepID=UPI003BF2DAB3
MTIKNFLVAPRIIQGETLSSWIHRLCQRQGISVEKLFQVLECAPPKDIDSERISDGILRLMSMTRHGIENFHLVKATNQSILFNADVYGQVRTGFNKSPVTAFCVSCLKTDTIPFYRIEWRFHFWKICPRHLINLLTRCPRCTNIPELKNPLLVSGNAMPNLAFCFFCQFDLRNAINAPPPVGSICSAEKLTVQQSMMAAIVHGYYEIQPLNEKFSLPSMFHLYRANLLQAPIEHSSWIFPLFGAKTWSRHLNSIDHHAKTQEQKFISTAKGAKQTKALGKLIKYVKTAERQNRRKMLAFAK